MSRRDLLLAGASLMLTGPVDAGQAVPQAFLLVHKYTCEWSEPDQREEFNTRFGLVRFGGAAGEPPLTRDLPGVEVGWEGSNDLSALSRTCQMLFLTGSPTPRHHALGAPALIESARDAGTLVVDLSSARLSGPVAGLQPTHEDAAADFIAAYVQQGVAFDIEDARTALSGASYCQAGIGVAVGEGSARSASLLAMKQAQAEAAPLAVRGQILLLAFGSLTGSLRRSKAAFNATRAALPKRATAIYGVSFDFRLRADAVRATIIRSFG